MLQNLMTQPARFVSSGQVLRLRLGLPMRSTIPFRLGSAQDDGHYLSRFFLPFPARFHFAPTSAE
jgi:hypothetical protein